jgi:hypothetical protein
MRKTKLDITCICFKRNKLTHHCFKSLLSIYRNWINHVYFLYFLPFASVQLTSPLADIATPPRHVMLPFHRVKISSLPSVHLLAKLRPVASPLKPKMKHWICTTTAGHPPRTAQLPPSTAIKGHLKLGHSPHHLTMSSFCLLPSQSTTSSELHLPPSLSFTVVPHMFIVPSYNDTHGDELAEPLSLPEQLIDIWIHIKRYFEIPQHRAGLSTSLLWFWAYLWRHPTV